MTDAAFTWSDEQWNTVRQTVHDEALRSRVAASFLPLFGPLPGDTQTVPMNILEHVIGAPGTAMRLGVVDYETIRLSTVAINVYLKNAQVADPELTSALMMFRRAAEVIARVEDAIIFNGQEEVGEGPKSDAAPLQAPPIFSVSGGGSYLGLRDVPPPENRIAVPDDSSRDRGENVFVAVVEAIQQIETAGYHGPFACVMGNDLFAAITMPVPKSMVLPRDSIVPFLNGPLTRSSVLPPNEAVLVSLTGAPVEIVVPSDISVRHVTTTPEAEHVFRVQQKFVLRVKEAAAVALISG